MEIWEENTESLALHMRHKRVYFPCRWKRNYEICCGALLGDIWVCHSTHSVAFSTSYSYTEAKLFANGGMQDCGRSKIFKEVEWEIDYCSSESYVPISCWEGVWYHVDCVGAKRRSFDEEITWRS